MTQADWIDSFGGRLARLRHDRGLTQEELADLSGLSARAISSLECGARHPRRLTVERIAIGLQLTPADRRRLVDAAIPARRRPERDPVPPPPPLIGRDREVSELRAHLRGEGPPALVLVGEPGIGKSRLLGQAGRLAAAAGVPVLHGVCRRGDDAHAPFADALARYALRLPGATPAASEPGARPASDAVLRLLAEAVRGAGRVCLLLDDMQWADAGTAELLGFLVERMGPRLRVTVTVRAGDTPPGGGLARCLADLARAGRVGQRDLDPLSDADALVLAKRREVVDRAGGLPLFLVDLAAVEQGIPPHLRLAVRQQLADLPADARALLQRMAAGPVVTSAERLLRGGGSAPGVLAALEPAISRRILDDTASGFRFRYPLFREVLLADLGPSRRSLLRHALTVLAMARPLGHARAF